MNNRPGQGYGQGLDDASIPGVRVVAAQGKEQLSRGTAAGKLTGQVRAW